MGISCAKAPLVSPLFPLRLLLVFFWQEQKRMEFFVEKKASDPQAILSHSLPPPTNLSGVVPEIFLWGIAHAL